MRLSNSGEHGSGAGDCSHPLNSDVRRCDFLQEIVAETEQEASPVDIAFEAYMRAQVLEEDSDDENSVEESSAVQGTEDVSLNEVPAQLGASLAQSQGTEAVSSNEVAGVCLLVYHASLYTVIRYTACIAFDTIVEFDDIVGECKRTRTS